MMRFLLFILFSFSLIAEETALNYPNIFGELQDVSEEEPSGRVWEHKLPFMAQEVLDLGFDLPFPYGVSIIYGHIDQDLLLDDLEVGINGSGTKPIDFVSFDNASASNDTVQLKVDAWVFPFLNLFGVLGAIDGEAPLEFTIDGNDWIAQSGKDCSRPGLKPPICKFENRLLTVPVDASYKGYNIGLGIIVAAGWEEYFLAMPLTYVYSDIDIADSRIETFNFSPRIGKTADLGEYGKLSPFIGAGYLDVEMDITGSVEIKGETIDYKIHQKNRDKWNALAGLNWDFNKHWSWNVEAGFWGSRENVITGVTFRY